MSSEQTPGKAGKYTLTLSQTEQGVIRVFSLSRPVADTAHALRQQSPAALASALLGHQVASDQIELFAIADLAGVGLPRYLMDGYDVAEDVLRPDRARLEALDGYVLLLHSGAARSGTLRLTPSHELTLIGTYAEPKADHTVSPLAVEAAMPYSGVSSAPRAPRRSRIGSAITALTILVAFLLIWWILR